MASDCSTVSFLLNGEAVSVSNPDPNETLLSYLRRSARLKGTKGVCLQGGCGACTVLLSSPAPQTLNANTTKESYGEGQSEAGVSHRAVNACLRPLCSVDGTAVTTVEGVGSTVGGMHQVQKQMTEKNASQCGFCTPGFVMSMYSHLKHKGTLSLEDAEGVPDGNICRCTGYRPILDAFQSLACGGCPNAVSSEAPSASSSTPSASAPSSSPSSASTCAREIEDLCVSSGRCLKKSVALGQGEHHGYAHAHAGKREKGEGAARKREVGLLVSKGGVLWRTVGSLEELFEAMQDKSHTTRLVCGNTSTGVYPPKEASLLLDVSRVPELRTLKVSPSGITLGGAVTLTELMETLEANEADCQSYAPLLKHLKRVANHQVRNVGSVVGNLMMTRNHPEFVSDLATLLTACGASLALASCQPTKDDPVIRVDLLSFLRREGLPAGVQNDDSLVVLSIHIPALRKASQKFLSYKVAQRAVNAHAIVNAAFVVSTDPSSGEFLEQPVLVFGGLDPLPSRAVQTEAFLVGKRASDPGVMEEAFSLLASELSPDPLSKKAAYRATLARSLLYKGLLSTTPLSQLPKDLLSTVTPFQRPLSSSLISYCEGDPSEYPVSKPMHKLSEAIQTTGEAKYLDDIDYAGEVFASYVPASVASATLVSLDATDALAMEGVVDFISAASLKAKGFCNEVSDGEELLVSSRVGFYGQPIGIILASSPEVADRAAKAVVAKYSEISAPILTLDDAIKADSFYPDSFRELKAGDFDAAVAAPDVVVVSGRTAVSHQYHFTTESQRAIAVPGEDGQLTVYSSSQNPALVQSVVAKGTGTPLHKVKVVVTRVGGAYGSKLNRCAPVGMAAAIAAKTVGRPVRLILDLSTNMQIVGGRSPYRCDYTIAVTKDGRITGIKMRILNNHGAHTDFEYPEMLAFLFFVDNVYNIQTWDIEITVAKTNLPSCTWIRAPGNAESLFVIESILEHVAAAVGMPPETVRERNLYKAGDITVWGEKLTYCNVQLVLATIKASASFEERLQGVSAYNSSSRWVKRGISLIPIKFKMSWAGQSFSVLINVYPDASVSISHGGCEVGQGLNVKVAQTASYALGQLTSDGCPMSCITVKETTTDVAISNSGTGGSIGSELCSMATKGACDTIVERLKVVASQMKANTESGSTVSWSELIAAAVGSGTDLQSRYRIAPGQGQLMTYCSFGAAVSEVEVDLLTGEFRILRSDLLLDCGQSLNPAIDVGQMQGAFVMGLGYLLTEEFEYDSQTGKLLSDSTWEYKPPSYADIPIDFRVSLLQKSGNPYGFLRSKASGEPPFAMACSAHSAIRHALMAGQKEVASRVQLSCYENVSAAQWVSLPAPATVERVCLSANIPAALLTL